MQEYLEIIQNEPTLKAVEENSAGSRPKELFLDVLEGVEARYARDRAALAEALQTMGPLVPDVSADTTTWEEFEAQFFNGLDSLEARSDSEGAARADAVRGVAPQALRLFFEELRGRAAKQALAVDAALSSGSEPAGRTERREQSSRKRRSRQSGSDSEGSDRRHQRTRKHTRHTRGEGASPNTKAEIEEGEVCD